MTPSNLIRSFAAMFLSEPHRTTRSYSRLSGRLGTEIFVEGHKLEPYYTAAYSLYKLEYLFRNQKLEAKYKPARYHFLHAIRLLSNPTPIPRMNSKDMERYCKNIMDMLWNNDKADELFSRAVSALDAVAKGNFDSDNIRTQPFTEQLQDYCRNQCATGAKSSPTTS